MFKAVLTSAFWTAIFTGVLTLYTAKLFQVSRTSNEINVATQRAAVSFIGMQGGPKITDPTGEKILGAQTNIVWQNSGSTPTRNAISHVNFQLWPSDLPDDFAYTDLPSPLRDRGVVIGPKAPMMIPLNLPLDDLEQVRQGKQHLFIHGWVTYNDVFQGTPKRLSEFCAEIINVVYNEPPEKLDRNASISWGNQACEKHNCTDEDCTDFASKTAVKTK